MSLSSGLRSWTFPAVAFFAWGLMCWPFLSGQVALSSDAVSYYDHTRFYLESLARGVFPLWDPHWSGGVPNDFFLRRIGPYNPFLLLPLLLLKLGVPVMSAYKMFTAGYFFFGMAGFRLLARRLLRNAASADLAFLILLFSALGTRMFDSYMLLVTVPVIWFFFALVAFFQKPRRVYAAGLTLALMVLLTTYIPLYFFLILAAFCLAYLLTGPRDMFRRCRQVADFIRAHKLFSGVCLLMLAFAALPGWSFFHGAGQGNIAIPGRHGTAAGANPLEVRLDAVNAWSILEEFCFAWFHTDLRRIAFAVVFVPLLAFVTLLAGMFVRVSRLFVLLLLWAGLIFLFSIPEGAPLYPFLSRHLGFIKYFRNLHFFLWFCLLPVFALFVAEVWRLFHEQSRGWPSWLAPLAVGLAHGAVLGFLCWQKDALPATFLAWVLSAGLWAAVLLRGAGSGWVPWLLLGAIVVQPFVVVRSLAANYRAEPAHYFYDQVGQEFAHTTRLRGEGRVPAPEEMPLPAYGGKPDSALYYTTSLYQALRAGEDAGTLERYERYKFYLYDTPPAEDGLSRAFGGSPVKGDSDSFRVVSFAPGQVVIRTDLPRPRFVVYNDAFVPGWTLSVNGRPASLRRANGAFKGFFLPAGKTEVCLRFGSLGARLMNILLLVSFWGMAAAVLVLHRRRSHG